MTWGIGNLAGPVYLYSFPEKNSGKEGVPDFWFSLSTVKFEVAGGSVVLEILVACLLRVFLALHAWSIRHAIRAFLSICRSANSNGKMKVTPFSIFLSSSTRKRKQPHNSRVHSTRSPRRLFLLLHSISENSFIFLQTKKKEKKFKSTKKISNTGRN